MTEGTMELEGGDGREIAIDGARHAYVCWGPSEAPPVLCLHGWLDNAASFAPLSACLPNLRLIALELAGHGHSEHRPASVPYHYLDWVRDVWRVADALGLSRLSLMGHSMGAGVAALAAGTQPERVHRLVMLEGTGPRFARPEDLPPSLAHHMREEAKAARIPPRTRPAAFATAVRARMVSSPLAQRSAELLARRGTQELDDGVLWRNDRRLSVLQPAQLDESQISAFLARIACPSLLVRADAGIPYDPALLERRLSLFPDLRQVEVAGRHHVHMDDPAVVAAHVKPFLAETEAAA